MSAPISPSLPSFDPTSADPFGFEGAEELWQSWHEGLKPDPLLTVSVWADPPEATASDAGPPATATAGLVREPARRGRRVFTPSYLA